MLKWLKDEIESFEWLKKWFRKKSFKDILKLICIIFFAFFWWDTYQYSKVWKVADNIYPEVLSNVEELHLMISNERDWTGIDFSKYKFLNEAYTQDFTTNKKELDRQLRNFYTGLKKVSLLTGKQDFDVLTSQGEYILNKFNYYFGCKDFFDFMERERMKPRVTSADTTVPRFYMVNYLRYKFH